MRTYGTYGEQGAYAERLATGRRKCEMLPSPLQRRWDMRYAARMGGWRSTYRRRWRSGSRRRHYHPRPETVRDVAMAAVRDKFVCMAPDRFRAFAEGYLDRYGRGAHQYLLKTYPTWQAAPHRMSGQTCTRLLACVPRYLSREDQLEIIGRMIPFILDALEAAGRQAAMSELELSRVYSGAIDSVLAKPIALDWIGFSDGELNELLATLKYSVASALASAHGRVVADIRALHALRRRFGLALEIHYVTEPLNVAVKIGDGSVNHNTDAVRVTCAAPQLESAFRHRYEAIIAEHILELHLQHMEGEVARTIAISDASTFLVDAELHKETRDVDCTIKAKGGGGTATLHYSLKARSGLFATMVTRSVWIAGLLLAALVLAIYALGKREACGLLWLVAICLGIAAHLVGELVELRKEMRKHGG